MIESTIQLVCDRCGRPEGAPTSFDDTTKTATVVMNDLRRQANKDGWEVVRTNGGLEDWCSACMEKHWAEMQQEPTT